MHVYCHLRKQSIQDYHLLLQISRISGQGKLLMRMLCVENNESAQRNGQEKGGWDAPINDEMREKWI
jgi:hypothetical protein